MSMPPPPPQHVQDYQDMINARIQGSHNVYDARESVIERSPTGSHNGRRPRNVYFYPKPSIAGGKKSKTYKKRGSRKRA